MKDGLDKVAQDALLASTEHIHDPASIAKGRREAFLEMAEWHEEQAGKAKEIERDRRLPPEKTWALYREKRLRHEASAAECRRRAGG